MADDGSQQTLEAGGSSATPLRVLIVDDNVDAARLLSMLAQFLGHEVTCAYDGAEAVQQVEQFQPDVVIMDLTMPRLSGYDAARQIRLQPWGQSVRLVALSGREEDEVRQRTRDAGFDDHVVKPLSPDALKALLAQMRPINRGRND